MPFDVCVTLTKRKCDQEKKALDCEEWRTKTEGGDTGDHAMPSSVYILRSALRDGLC